MNNKKNEAITPKADESNKEQVKSLDELLEVLDQDDLRHVVGGLRPKGRYDVVKQ